MPVCRSSRLLNESLDGLLNTSTLCKSSAAVISFAGPVNAAIWFLLRYFPMDVFRDCPDAEHIRPNCNIILTDFFSFFKLFLKDFSSLDSVYLGESSGEKAQPAEDAESRVALSADVCCGF